MRLIVLLSGLIFYYGAFQPSFSEPLSIVFIIDNSGSMSGENGDGANDQWGTRFRVVSNLLDSIFTAEPASEIGLVIFREYLFLDTTSQAYYTQYFHSLSKTYDDNPNQAYLPFMQLNAAYSGSLSRSQEINKSGIEVIKDILQTDTVRSNFNRYVELKYSPNFTDRGYTNINIALIAAKEIFLNAKNSKDRQSIIFLSDGESQGPLQAGLDVNWFQTQGTQCLPTTFTVFFTPYDVAPASLQTMTKNIGINGYSPSNISSNLWTTKANYDALLSLLVEKVLGSIVSISPNMHSHYTVPAEDILQTKFYDLLGRQLAIHSRKGSNLGLIKMSNSSCVYISKSHRNTNSVAHEIFMTR